ncbi:MAG: GldG family protein [Spirochaetales bacterium]|nr:GldG family protein [Spirochaetales bacterium]
MNGKMKEILLTLLTLLVLVLVAANSTVFYTRLDLTENKAFSISDVSKNLFREIPDQVHITYYISERLAGLSPIPGQIEDLLYEYAAHGRGRIRVSVVAPEKEKDFKPEEAGVVPQEITVLEKNEQSVAIVYSGIVLAYMDNREVLPVVANPVNLEYDLTRRIKKLVNDERPSAGFLLGDRTMSLSRDMSAIGSRLAASYSVREISPGEEIPEDISLLFVFGGKDLSEADLYAVDQYIMAGGKAFIAMDRVDIDLMRNLEASPYDEELPIFSLLAAYGVSVEKNLVLDANARRIPVQRDTGFMRVQAYEIYNHWVSVQGQGLSRVHPVTAGLSVFDLYWPSSLAPREIEGVQAENLLSSGPDSWLISGERYPTNPYEAGSFRAIASDKAGRYPLGIALSGTFPSYFAGKKAPPEKSGDSGFTRLRKDLSEETRLIVLGDADASRDILLNAAGSEYNLAFFENAADWLSGEDSLMTIRARSMRDTRLARIEDKDVRDGFILFSEIVNLVLVPVFVAGAGILRSMRRRTRHDL